MSSKTAADIFVAKSLIFCDCSEEKNRKQDDIICIFSEFTVVGRHNKPHCHANS